MTDTMTEERYIHLHLDGGQIQVKLDDEGVVVDAIGDDGEIVGSTWKLYTELGVEVKPILETQKEVSA
tara:strand:+ start:267 stop:470 length:204 start_codon:yes stop_codon:yes gene_type:complete